MDRRLHRHLASAEAVSLTYAFPFDDLESDMSKPWTPLYEAIRNVPGIEARKDGWYSLDSVSVDNALSGEVDDDGLSVVDVIRCVKSDVGASHIPLQHTTKIDRTRLSHVETEHLSRYLRMGIRICISQALCTHHVSAESVKDMVSVSVPSDKYADSMKVRECMQDISREHGVAFMGNEAWQFLHAATDGITGPDIGFDNWASQYPVKIGWFLPETGVDQKSVATFNPNRIMYEYSEIGIFVTENGSSFAIRCYGVFKKL